MTNHANCGECEIYVDIQSSGVVSLQYAQHGTDCFSSISHQALQLGQTVESLRPSNWQYFPSTDRIVASAYPIAATGRRPY